MLWLKQTLMGICWPAALWFWTASQFQSAREYSRHRKPKFDRCKASVLVTTNLWVNSCRLFIHNLKSNKSWKNTVRQDMVLYSVHTGEEIFDCPATLADLEALTSELRLLTYAIGNIANNHHHYHQHQHHSREHFTETWWDRAKRKSAENTEAKAGFQYESAGTVIMFDCLLPLAC